MHAFASQVRGLRACYRRQGLRISKSQLYPLDILSSSFNAQLDLSHHANPYKFVYNYSRPVFGYAFVSHLFCVSILFIAIVFTVLLFLGLAHLWFSSQLSHCVGLYFVI